ncbi:DUF6046 domain-containing protein [Tenacibaculum agarivorans]|uniref:DUF6046 domain-containing protein n=1 Tax=Tenacibaculum agarivorans TaxID=1908389 RepID=UPI00094B80DD|nr:DUF6046 domain-containing protein [Tenacibaculum agarivorans]
MSFSYNIPNLLNSLKLQQSRGLLRNVANVLTASDANTYNDSLKNLTEEYFFQPLKDYTEVDEFIMAGGSFNLPVFAPLIIELPQAELLEKTRGTKLGEELKSNSFLTELSSALIGFRLDGVAISVSRSKNIVTTAIQGRNHTVKEFISNGDHEITVEGVLATNGKGYPTAQVVQLRRIFDSNKSLKVINVLLQKMGIFELVITNYDFPSNDGLKNIQPFSFSALSEQPLEIKKKINEESLKDIKETIAISVASRF